MRRRIVCTPLLFWKQYTLLMRPAGAAGMRKATQHCVSPETRVASIAKRTHCERTTRFSFGPEDFQMEAKFAVGDRVDHSPRDRFVGTVKAVYMTREGEARYAVDMEGHGTLQLCSEHTIVAHNH
jgi:hypothetical protein